MLMIALNPLLNVRVGENFIRLVVAAKFDHGFHKLVVGNAIVTVPAESRARIHNKAEQHPALRVFNVVAAQLAAVHFVHRIQERIQG